MVGILLLLLLSGTLVGGLILLLFFILYVIVQTSGGAKLSVEKERLSMSYIASRKSLVDICLNWKISIASTNSESFKSFRQLEAES